MEKMSIDSLLNQAEKTGQMSDEMNHATKELLGFLLSNKFNSGDFDLLVEYKKTRDALGIKETESGELEEEIDIDLIEDPQEAAIELIKKILASTYMSFIGKELRVQVNSDLNNAEVTTSREYATVILESIRKLFGVSFYNQLRLRTTFDTKENLEVREIIDNKPFNLENQNIILNYYVSKVLDLSKHVFERMVELSLVKEPKKK